VAAETQMNLLVLQEDQVLVAMEKEIIQDLQIQKLLEMVQQTLAQAEAEQETLDLEEMVVQE
jgi:hypothetical protein